MQSWGYLVTLWTSVLQIRKRPKSESYISVRIKRKTYKFLVNTGSAVSIMSMAGYDRFRDKYLLLSAVATLYVFSQWKMEVLGCLEIAVALENRCACILFYVV